MTLKEQIQANRIIELEEQLRESEEDCCLLKIENNTSADMINVIKRELRAYREALQAYRDALDLDKARDTYRRSGWVNTVEGIVELITDQVKRNIE